MTSLDAQTKLLVSIGSERTVSKPSETVPTNLRSETLVPVAIMANSLLLWSMSMAILPMMLMDEQDILRWGNTVD